MESLLTPIRTRNQSALGHEVELLTSNTKPRGTKQQNFSLTSVEDVLELLKSKPDRHSLGKALGWLSSSADRQEEFNLKKPGPKATQIIYVLVNDIIPDYWTTLSGDASRSPPKEKRLLLQCLRSVAGIGAIASRLRLLIGLLKESQGHAKVDNTNKAQPLEELLDLIENVLDGDGFISLIWNDINACISQSSQKSLQWKELLSVFASGKVLSLTSEATIILNNLNSSVKAGSWVGDGNQYATWLGRNIQHMLKALLEDDVESKNAISQLLKKAFTLGYTG